jgi:hypothetical protein
MNFKTAALNDSEELDVDKIFLAMDFFREAIYFSRGKCLEIESEVLSRLGELNDFVRKDKHKAKEYYAACLNLAHSMVPMNFGNRDWYKLARERLQKLREETERKAENEWAKKREPVLEKIKSILEKVKAEKDKGAELEMSTVDCDSCYSINFSDGTRFAGSLPLNPFQ